MVNALIGQKKGMSQVWDKTGRRLPVTEINVAGNVAVRFIGQANKNQATQADDETRTTTSEIRKVQIGFGNKKQKNLSKALVTQLEKAGIKNGRRLFKEVEVQQDEIQPGQEIKVEQVISVGDILKISGTTKGRGFAGAVKRWGFAGGPKTHGQSDRERATGSIGQGTTPGRVFKGKKMPGHYGVDTQTLVSCSVVAIDPEKQSIWIKGTLPGAFNSFVYLTKQDKKTQLELNQASLDLLGIKPATESAQTEPEGEAEVKSEDKATDKSAVTDINQDAPAKTTTQNQETKS